MQPGDIAGIRQIGDLRVSPDGSAVAFGLTTIDLDDNRYTSRLWLAASDGSDRPRPFTSGPDDRLPRWSPDGRFLAFAVQQHGAAAQVCVIPVSTGGERVVVASWPGHISELEWSPDGSQIAMVARDPDAEAYGRPGEPVKEKERKPKRDTRLMSRIDSEGWLFDQPNRVLVVPSDGSAPPRVLTDGEFQSEGITWSPDGTRIAFTSGRHESFDLDWITDIWTVATDGKGDPQRVTAQRSSYALPSWSPDGSRIAFFSFHDPMVEPTHGQLGVVELSSGETIELTTDLDRNCAPYGSARPAVWDGERLLFGIEDSGNAHIYAVAADGNGKADPVLDGERWVSSWDYSGGTLAAAVTTPLTFTELVTKKIESSHSEERTLTDISRHFKAFVELVEPVPYTARSADGTEVPCWGMPPVGAERAKRYPTLLNVHGGPFTQYGNKFFDEFQIECGAGFGVLYCNPRGSSGYSQAWGRAIRWPECEVDPGTGWGSVDFDDVMACVEEAAKRFEWVDPDRVGILGGSYGGYMTSWAISHTDRFKAAISERACNNLLSMEGTSDIGGFFRAYAGKSHLEIPDAYLRQSPITYVENITTPVMLLHSEDDLRCPISQAEELFVSLRLLGRGPVLIRFPGESHELSRSGSPRHRIKREELILEWFSEHL